MASGGRRGAKERVLGSRHVIGLFMLMLVFSAVFFTLGYVMGRNQYSGQVGASTVQHNPLDSAIVEKPEKPDAIARHPAKKSPAPDAAPSDSGWDQYSSDKEKETGEHLKAVVPPASAAPKSAPSSNLNSRLVVPNNDSPRAPQASGGYWLQVSAMRRESEAHDLARRLKAKKFPAFVMAPLGNKYYRVQVGPYADKKSAEAAKKGLENAGFRAIVKRG
jgi:cell division septation protein DedD